MYKLQTNGILRLSDGAFIPDAPGNRDWQEYQEWLAEGNTPDPQYTPQEEIGNLKRDIAHQRDMDIADGFEYTLPDGAEALITLRTQQDFINFLGLASASMAAILSNDNTPFPYINGGDSLHELSPQEMLQFTLAVFQHVSSKYLEAWQARQELN